MEHVISPPRELRAFTGISRRSARIGENIQQNIISCAREKNNSFQGLTKKVHFKGSLSPPAAQSTSVFIYYYIYITVLCHQVCNPAVIRWIKMCLIP
jgi:hypothetical protein